MTWESVQNRNTQFLIDWDVVRRLVRSYWMAKAQLDYGRQVTISESDWYNPMSWSLPDVSHVEVDWEKVKNVADGMTESDMSNYRNRATFDAAGVAAELDEMVDIAAMNKEKFLDWMGFIQTQNMEQIQKSVKDYEADIGIAKFVRDTSADGVMVGASILTGGAATAAMGGGSLLKGAFKFQDTGSVGAASMEAVGSFAFASVKIGKTFSFKQDMVLTIVQATWKAGTELVGGATVKNAVLSGALKLTGPTVDRIFKTGPAKTLFDVVSVPIWVQVRNLPGDEMWEDQAGTVAGKLAAKFVQRQGIETMGKKMLASGSPPSTTSDRIGPVVQQMTMTNKLLLYLAFVNMDKGIGRGW
jgi:hypothetical protein